MAWGRLDDKLYADPKLTAAGPAAAWACVCSWSWSNAHGTDGFIPSATVRTLATPAVVKRLTARLVPDRGPLWDTVEGGFLIHDFFEDGRNRPAAWWRELKQNRKQNGSKGGSKTQAKPQAEAQAKLKPVPGPVKSANADRDAVEQVYRAWLDSGGWTPEQRDLTDQRREKIRARLKHYPLADVVDAARGWVNDPWGERINQADLTILLRSDEQCEKFRNLWRSGPAQNGKREQTEEEIRADFNRAAVEEGWASRM